MCTKFGASVPMFYIDVFCVIADVVDGTKSGDGSRQRSASQEQSPTRVANILHPGQSGLISIPRSSSDTNLVMDTDKKGIYVTYNSLK